MDIMDIMDIYTSIKDIYNLIMDIQNSVMHIQNSIMEINHSIWTVFSNMNIHNPINYRHLYFVIYIHDYYEDYQLYMVMIYICHWILYLYIYLLFK